MAMKITFLVRPINVDGHAYVTEGLLPLGNLLALQARGTQKTDTLEVLRYKALFALEPTTQLTVADRRRDAAVL